MKRDNHILFAFTKRLLLLIIIIASSFQIYAQDEGEISKTQFDRQEWESLVNDADYFKKERDKERREVSVNGPSEINLGGIKYLLIGFAIILIVFILLKVFAAELFINAKNKDGKISFSIDNLDDNLEEAPLYKWLKEAISKHQYKLAIRIYYLITLQELNERKLISWHKDKTNAHYIREMRKNNEGLDFKKLTLIFEHVWYGPFDEITLNDYENIQPAFNQYLNKITSKR